jgi:uncharacterized protein DUF4352
LYLLHDGVRQTLYPDPISDEVVAAFTEDDSIGGGNLPFLPQPTAQRVMIVATPTPYPPPSRATLQYGGKAMTVLSVERPAVPPPYTAGGMTGNQGLMVITVRLDNHGTDAMYVNPLSYKVQLANLYIYQSVTVLEEGYLDITDVPPGRSRIGKIFYIVPKGVATDDAAMGQWRSRHQLILSRM